MKTFHLGFTGEEVHTLYGVWAFYVLSFFFFFFTSTYISMPKRKNYHNKFQQFQNLPSRNLEEKTWQNKLSPRNMDWSWIFLLCKSLPLRNFWDTIASMFFSFKSYQLVSAIMMLSTLTTSRQESLQYSTPFSKIDQISLSRTLSGKSDFDLADTSNLGIQMIWPHRFLQGPQNPPSSNQASSYWKGEETAHQQQPGPAMVKKHLWKHELLLFVPIAIFWVSDLTPEIMVKDRLSEPETKSDYSLNQVAWLKSL